MGQFEGQPTDDGNSPTSHLLFDGFVTAIVPQSIAQFWRVSPAPVSHSWFPHTAIPLQYPQSTTQLS